MGKTSISNKLNHKPQAHAGVCEENEEGNKKRLRLKYFTVKGLTLEGCRRTVTRPIQVKLTTRIIHNLNVIVQ